MWDRFCLNIGPFTLFVLVGVKTSFCHKVYKVHFYMLPFISAYWEVIFKVLKDLSHFKEGRRAYRQLTVNYACGTSNQAV